MARLIRPLKKTLLCCSSSSTLLSRMSPLHLQQEPPSLQFAEAKLIFPFNPKLSPQSPRYYISEMRKSAFEGYILRLLRNEIQYELERSSPTKPVTKFKSFTVEDRPGEQWISLKRKYGDKENIKVEATMFDGPVPASKSSGGVGGKDIQLHITMIVNISKEDGGNVLEIMCSVWSDSMEIDKIFVRKPQKPAQPYEGPEFEELDDELQDSLYEFLEARDISDELAVFLHEYMKNKDKTELIRWMDSKFRKKTFSLAIEMDGNEISLSQEAGTSVSPWNSPSLVTSLFGRSFIKPDV